MVRIYNESGRKVAESKNLRGILDYARKSPVTSIVADENALRHNDKWHDTSVVFSFCDGATSNTEWASFDVLVDWVASRRSWGKVAPVITGESPHRKAEWNY